MYNFAEKVCMLVLNVAGSQRWTIKIGVLSILDIL